MIIKHCLTCKKEFKTIPALLKLGKGKYCSRKCVRQFYKGSIYFNQKKFLYL